MGKILLINPASKLVKQFKSSKKLVSVSPPLGLVSIASVLEERFGSEVGILDIEARQISIGEVIRCIDCIPKGDKPKLIGLTATTPTYDRCVELARRLKAAFDVRIAIGGPHVSAMPRKVMEEVCFDYAVCGEGEYAITRIAETVINGRRKVFPQGIYYRVNGTVKGEGRTKRVDLNRLPHGAWHLLSPELYKAPADVSVCIRDGRYLHPYVSIVSSRGCPFSCIFCCQAVFTKKWMAMSAKRFVDELEYMNKVNRARFFNIFDDTFTISKQRVLEICRLIRERKMDIKFYCRSRVDTIDEEMLDALKSAGCVIISYGVEAGSNESLKRIKKNTTVERIRRIFKATKDRGIATRGYFMIGNYMEDEGDVLNTINLAKRLNPMFSFFNITTLFPCTELHDIYVDAGGMSKDHDWRKGMPIYEANLTADDMRRLKRKAYRDFYLRIPYIFSLLPKIRTLRQFVAMIKCFREVGG